MAILPILMLITAGCGLPTEPYLYPPISRTSIAEPDVLLFENPDGNDPDVFLGYLLFYKIFNVGDPVLSGDLQATGESFFTTFRLNSYDIPQERGVNDRYTLFETFTVPFGERNDNFLVRLNFSDADNTFGEYPAYDATPTESFPVFYRKFRALGASESEWTKLAFSSIPGDYDAGDSDLPSAFGTELVCAVWAVAYGFDIFDSFQNVYSTAEYIGRFDVFL